MISLTPGEIREAVADAEALVRTEAASELTVPVRVRLPFGHAVHGNARRVHRVQSASATWWRKASTPAVKRYRVVWACGPWSQRVRLVSEIPDSMTPCDLCFPEHAEPPHPAVPHVYFAERDGLIKIGRSIDPAKRVVQLEADLLAMHPGSFDVEATLHRLFAAARVHGEWFEPTAPLLDYIALVEREGAP